MAISTTDQPTSKDLLSELRDAVKSGKGNYGHRLLCGQAADEIEHLANDRDLWRGRASKLEGELEAAEQHVKILQEQRDDTNKVMNFDLPCDVKVEPATVIRAGCHITTLLTCLKERIGKTLTHAIEYQPYSGHEPPAVTEEGCCHCQGTGRIGTPESACPFCSGEGVRRRGAPKPINHELWRHMYDEHELILLQSELDEILRLAQPPNLPVSETRESSTPPPPVEQRETGWLVEGRFGENHSAIRYRWMDDAGPHWTADVNQAMRFARRADAEMFAAGDDDASAIVEHVWVTPTKVPE